MWLSDFTLVLPDRVIERGSLRIENGQIAEIAESPVSGGIAGDGLHLMAGFIDMHGDMIEVELEPRPHVDMPMELALTHLDARLAASGVTTAYAAVSFSRGNNQGGLRSFEHTHRTIADFYAIKDRMRVDHRIHARFDITFDNAVGVLADLIGAGHVDLVSVMDHTPGQGQYRDIEKFIEKTASVQGLSQADAREKITRRIAERTRPEELILAVLDQVSRLCRDHGVPLASHDDDTVEKARLMVGIGAAISEFPVTLEAAREGVAGGMMTAMGAPNVLRGKSYSGNLSGRDAHAAGLLHILAADYHPGTFLPAIKVLAASDPNGLPGAVALATSNPAQALGLGDRGALVVGKRADLAVADMAGLGRVVASFSTGTPIFSDGTLSMLPAAGMSNIQAAQ
tara:strand:- start:16607 stop:17800 length:1194 start_codon:yes stop_codon:yes gene_type:complete